MTSIQTQFEAFDNAIKLGRFEENQTLRDKRDIIRNKLKAQLPEIFKKHNESCPGFFFRDQGSYEMGTGIKPLDGDYDIDQGLYFQASITNYPDSVTLKQRVYEALDDHTKDIRIRQPCVTIFYQQAGESIYHVDLAIYSDGSTNADGKPRLARGKVNSTSEYRRWEVSNPQFLSETILARFQGSSRDQFRRIVRYLKRWKCQNFSTVGHEAPIGIGLTIATYDYHQPTYTNDFDYRSNDLGALRTLVRALLNQFTLIWHDTEHEFAHRLLVKLPIEPYADLFERMTNIQMQNLEAQLKKLLLALDRAADEVDPVTACEQLRLVFGTDFPVPARAETAKRHHPVIVTSSSSA